MVSIWFCVFAFFSGYKCSLILLSTFVYLHSFFFHNVFSPTMNNESTYRKFLCFLLSWLLRPNFFFSSHELFVNRFSFVLFFLLLALWVLCYYYFFEFMLKSYTVKNFLNELFLVSSLSQV